MRSKSWRSESPAGVLFASFALVSPSCATRRSWRRRAQVQVRARATELVKARRIRKRKRPRRLF